MKEIEKMCSTLAVCIVWDLQKSCCSGRALKCRQDKECGAARKVVWQTRPDGETFGQQVTALWSVETNNKIETGYCNPNIPSFLA